MLSPDDTYALEPAIGGLFGNDEEVERDVRRVSLDDGARRQIAFVTPDASDDGDPEHGEAFRVSTRSGVGICSTGSIFAINDARELAIVRASNGATLATLSNPDPGTPIFTPDGRYVMIDDAVYALRSRRSASNAPRTGNHISTKQED